MDEAIKFMKEINRKRKAINSTKSDYLVNDYSKSVRRDIEDLKFYCRCHGISFAEVVKLAG